MHKLVSILLSLPLVACVIGSSQQAGDDTTTNPPPTGTGTSGPQAGHISANTTWSGAMSLSGDMTVDPNVTVTVAAGTALAFAQIGSLTVLGTVDIQGTKAQPVNITSAGSGGFTVATGGTLKMSYATQVGGDVVVTGGSFTATDTYMSRAIGDFLIVSAGTVNVSYSQLGLDTQTGDSTHCDLHFEGSKGTTLSVTHSTISTSTYGLMLYNGTGVDLTFNNWVGNQTDIDFAPGVQGDVSNGWFASGSAPTPTGGAVLTANNLSPTRLPAGTAGPR